MNPTSWSKPKQTQNHNVQVNSVQSDVRNNVKNPQNEQKSLKPKVPEAHKNILMSLKHWTIK